MVMATDGDDFDESFDAQVPGQPHHPDLQPNNWGEILLFHSIIFVFGTEHTMLDIFWHLQPDSVYAWWGKTRNKL